MTDDAADPHDVTQAVDLPPLPETTILLVEVGSTAHGTGIPGGEDYDQLGVVVERPDFASDVPDELAAFIGLDDWYDLLRDGVLSGSVDAVDEAVMHAARSLAAGEPPVGFDLAQAFLADSEE